MNKATIIFFLKFCLIVVHLLYGIFINSCSSISETEKFQNIKGIKTMYNNFTAFVTQIEAIAEGAAKK